MEDFSKRLLEKMACSMWTSKYLNPLRILNENVTIFALSDCIYATSEQGLVEPRLILPTYPRGR